MTNQPLQNRDSSNVTPDSPIFKKINDDRTDTGGYLDNDVLWLPYVLPYFENTDEAFRYLKTEIQHYSEMHWCAGWFQDIEFIIWLFAHRDVDYSMFDKNLCRKLVEIGKRHNVWLYWDSGINEVLPTTIDEWEEKMANWQE